MSLHAPLENRRSPGLALMVASLLALPIAFASAAPARAVDVGSAVASERETQAAVRAADPAKPPRPTEARAKRSRRTAKPAPAREVVETEKPVGSEVAATPGTSGAAGMRAIRDPETGERVARPVRGAGAVAPRPAGPYRSSAGLRSEIRPDGTVLLHLDERYMEYAVVRIDANGKRHLSCVSGPAAVQRARDARPAPLGPAVEE